jgi:hypothetical protein
MPSAIELSINNTLTVFHRAGPDALRSEPLEQRTPVATSQTAPAVRSGVIDRVDRPLVAPQKARQIQDGVRVGTFELQLQQPDIMEYQRLVCLKQDGKFTAQTRAAIMNWLTTNNKKDKNFPNFISANDGITLREALDAPPRC